MINNDVYVVSFFLSLSFSFSLSRSFFVRPFLPTCVLSLLLLLLSENIVIVVIYQYDYLCSCIERKGEKERKRPESRFCREEKDLLHYVLPRDGQKSSENIHDNETYALEPIDREKERKPHTTAAHRQRKKTKSGAMSFYSETTGTFFCRA